MGNLEGGGARLPRTLTDFFLDPDDVRSLSLRPVWNFSKVTGLP